MLRDDLQRDGGRLRQRHLRHLRRQRTGLLRRRDVRCRFPLFREQLRRLRRTQPTLLQRKFLRAGDDLWNRQHVRGLRRRWPAMLWHTVHERQCLHRDRLPGVRRIHATVLRGQRVHGIWHRLRGRKLCGLWRRQSTLLRR